MPVVRGGLCCAPHPDRSPGTGPASRGSFQPPADQGGAGSCSRPKADTGGRGEGTATRCPCPMRGDGRQHRGCPPGTPPSTGLPQALGPQQWPGSVSLFVVASRPLPLFEPVGRQSEVGKTFWGVRSTQFEPWLRHFDALLTPSWAPFPYGKIGVVPGGTVKAEERGRV